MNPKEHQQKLENLRAVAALAPLVTALYGANETTALNTVTNTIREALGVGQDTRMQDEAGAPIAPAPTKESELDVVITLNGQRATGKTVLANKILKLLRSEGFSVVTKDTDGSVDILRVLDPAKAFRTPAAEQATDTPICDCPRCRMERGEPVSASEKRVIELLERAFGGRIFGQRG